MLLSVYSCQNTLMELNLLSTWEPHYDNNFLQCSLFKRSIFPISSLVAYSHFVIISIKPSKNLLITSYSQPREMSINSSLTRTNWMEINYIEISRRKITVFCHFLRLLNQIASLQCCNEHTRRKKNENLYYYLCFNFYPILQVQGRLTTIQLFWWKYWSYCFVNMNFLMNCIPLGIFQKPII